jgi:hypothetical protein
MTIRLLRLENGAVGGKVRVIIDAMGFKGDCDIHANCVGDVRALLLDWSASGPTGTAESLTGDQLVVDKATGEALSFAPGVIRVCMIAR